MADLTPTVPDDGVGLFDAVSFELTTRVSEGSPGLTDVGARSVHTFTFDERIVRDDGSSQWLTLPGGTDFYVTPADGPLGITDGSVSSAHQLTVFELNRLTDPSPIVQNTTSNTILRSFDDESRLADFGADRSFGETVEESLVRDDPYLLTLLSSGFNTLASSATASGELGIIWSPDAPFSTLGGSAAAVGGEAHLYSDLHFQTLPASINNQAVGNTGSLIGSSSMTELATAEAVATGLVGSLKTPDGVFRTDPLVVNASGRDTALFGDGVRVEAEVVLTLTAEVSVARDAFQAPNPHIIPEIMTEFVVTPWRLNGGIPRADAKYRTTLSCDARLGEKQTQDPFLAPGSASTRASYRWLATDYESPEWDPSGVSSGFDELRSWADVSGQFTWETMALRTWDGVLHDTQDPNTPSWAVAGVDEPTLMTDYTYWRNGEYVTNPAVLVEGDASLEMTWQLGDFVQSTTLMVLVPRTPTGGDYELVRINSDIRLMFTSESTLVLLNGTKVLYTAVVASRTRPNEPIVVALSVNTLLKRVSLGVMDVSIRTMQSNLTSAVDPEDIEWTVGGSSGSKFELLELSVYSMELGLDQLALEMSTYDRIYGVTVP